jgi:hypothetical protein
MPIDELIDLDYDSVQGSLMRKNFATPSEQIRVGQKGILAGVAIGAVLGLAYCMHYYSSLPEFDDATTYIKNITMAFWVVGGALAGLAICFIGFSIEHRKAFLFVDDYKIMFRKKRKIATLPLDKVFGAAIERDAEGLDVLRIWTLADTPLGFDSLMVNFDNFEAVSGYAANAEVSCFTGNELALRVIIHHVSERRRANLHVADLPPFPFQIEKRMDGILDLATGIDVSFACDGKIITYIENDEKYTIPVRDVRKVIPILDLVGGVAWTSEYGSPGYKGAIIRLELDPSNEAGPVSINVNDIPQSHQIEKYLMAMPGLIPKSEDESYWK